VVAEIERTILTLTSRGEMSTLLVEQHVGFALAAASRYYVMEAGRITSTGDGGTDAHEHVRAAMAI
jgi:urea transport system ATP-binding protein